MATERRCDTPQPLDLPRREGCTRLTLHNITAADAAGLLDEVTTIVSRAAAAILAVRSGALATRLKPDRSPVTAADEAAEAVIIAGLSRLAPGLPIVSEEAASHTPPGNLGDSFALVDPLDGTREFLERRDEFTVNLAFVYQRQPVLGVISAPSSGLIWRAVAGRGAERMQLAPGAPVSAARERIEIRPRAWPGGPSVAAVSRSHLDPRTADLLARLAPVERIASGSSIKLCWIAEGSADLYPRLAPTREWDIAAGHAIVAAAGGTMAAPDGKALHYGGAATGFLVPGFIAWGDPSVPARLGAKLHGA
jgi:3'(2'), 5'-bisphosphate nucleotidase